MRLITTLLLTLLAHHLSAQCYGGPTAYIEADSQEELEAYFDDGEGGFKPICAEFGGLRLTNVSDLSVLQGLEKVNIELWIRDCPELTSLEGLDQLIDAGWLVISRCENLEDISALDGVKSARDISLSYLGQVASISLPSLVSTNDLYIQNNSNLATIQLTEELDTLESLIIQYNPQLTSIAGPPAISQIGTLEPWGGNGTIQIQSNASLETITGFNSLQEVTAISIGQGNEQSRPDIQAFSGVRRTNSVNLTNISSCNFSSLQEVTYNIKMSDGIGDVAPFSSLMTIGGDLTFDNTDLQYPPEFPSLQSVGGNLIFQSNPDMVAFSGFNAIQTIGGDANFRFSPIETFTGFNNLREIGRDFKISLYELVECSAFNVLDNVDGWFQFFSTSVEELNSFDALESVGGDFWFAYHDSLVRVNGFYNINSIGGDVHITNNDKLADCAVFCPLLAPGVVGGNINIRFNKAPCDKESLEQNCATRVIDANPALINTWLGGNVDSVDQLSIEDLVALSPEQNLYRTAVAADGVTEVVILTEFGEPGQFDFEVNGQPLDKPWGPSAIQIDDKYYGAAIFKAPEGFPEVDGEKREFATIDIAFSGDQLREYSQTIQLVRPPVVLVHGTFDTPEDAWKTGTDLTPPLWDVLTFKGYNLYAVDYESTNGESFETNKMVIWENPGGIKEAVEDYRENRQWACTQADVIGHSMGGVLARVYASENFNTDPGYKRPDNFMEGDINRLITIGSTHGGSDMAAFKNFLSNRSFFSDNVAWAEGYVFDYISTYMTGTSTTPAILDQLPLTPGEETTLENIGATPIPSHAIASFVKRDGLKDLNYDPDSLYHSTFRYMALGMYYAGALRESYVMSKKDLCDAGLCPGTDKTGEMIELFDGLSEEEVFEIIDDYVRSVASAAGQILEIIDGNFEFPTETEIAKYILKRAMGEVGMGDVADPFIQALEGVDPRDILADWVVRKAKTTINDYLEDEQTREFEEDMIETMRFLVFNHDENDGTVRVESQLGGLEAPYSRVFENGLHSYQPRYPDIQAHIVNLLETDMAQFDTLGFPAIEQPLNFYYPSEKIEFYNPWFMGEEAICRSGMLPEHARAYARVADREEVVIIVRPVNPDGLPLLANGAATKKMPVKPKSSNWGPQKGYLPVNQRYSKIPKVFGGGNWADKVETFNAKAQQNLNDGTTLQRHLQINTCDGNPFWVYIDHSNNTGVNNMDLSVEDEIWLVPVSDPDMLCAWKEISATEFAAANCHETSPENVLEPLYVMASPDFSDASNAPRYLTADYDLLMIGFKNENGNPYNPPENIPFDPERGQITTQQKQLVDKLNSEANHEGGDLTHHGPENQFSQSPYIDYPLTAFVPDENSSEGQILLITMGPVPFRDINLKRFVNEWRLKGYDLYDNRSKESPGWKWKWNENIPGFELTDSSELGPYIEQVLTNVCEKGNSPDICPESSSANNNKPSSISQGQGQSLTVSPNPAFGSEVNIHYRQVQPGDITWRIVDSYGNTRSSGRIDGHLKETQWSIDISGLESGMYYLVTSDGLSKRFVRP